MKQKQFYYELIRAKLQSYEDIIVKCFTLTPKRLMTKREFRRMIVNNDVPLSRFETHFLIKECLRNE